MPRGKQMDVIISIRSKHMMYHKRGCYRINRMKSFNKVSYTLPTATERGYSPCPYCGGLLGDLRVGFSEIKEIGEKNGFRIFYDTIENKLFIRTDIGFWKVVEAESDQFVLLHANNREISGDPSDDELRNIGFHIQKSAGNDKSLTDIIKYIEHHENYKRKQLELKKQVIPKNPPLKKRKKKKKKSIYDWGNRNRVDQLLRKLKEEDSEIENASTWQ